MSNTQARIPADLLLEFTQAIWRNAQDKSESLAGAPDIRQILDTRMEAAEAEELGAFLARLEELTLEQRRVFTAAIDEVQVRSKLWLIDELAGQRSLAGVTMVVLGAWHGILPLLINWRLAYPPGRMVCADIDKSACALGRQVIGPLYDNIEYRLADAMEWDYISLAAEPSSVLVNTICEHLPDAAGWWQRVPAGQFAVLQSNNYDLCPDHVNWVPGLEEMKAQTPMAEPVYEGTLNLPIFDRFMLIGHR
jgi:hypothetical protein